jgi:DNA-nicking Smr family endonuclease
MTRKGHHSRDPIRIPIEDSIDLHTFSPKEIPSLLEEYLDECIKAGIYEVRIIHGKGMGHQRRRVHSFLSKSPLVHSFSTPPPTSGGWGSTIALLRRR